MVCLKRLCHELGYCSFWSLRNGCATLITLCHYPFAICTSPIIHLGSPPPPPPKKVLHNFCFSFPLGIAVVPGEIEDNTYAKVFWGQTRCIIGDLQIANTKCSSGRPIIAFLYLSRIKLLEKEFCRVNSPPKQPLSFRMYQQTLKKSPTESHQPL